MALPLPSSTQRLRLVVPHHDGADQLAGWYLLSVFLQRALGVAMRVEAAPRNQTGDLLGEATGLVICADARAVAQGVSQHGWIPVVRPMQCFEEVLILARKGAASPASRPLQVACGNDHWLLPELGVALLAEQGLTDDDWLLQPHDTAERALMALASGQSPLALVSVADWQRRSDDERALFYKVAQSRSEVAFPALCVSADLKSLRARLIDAFASLHSHPSGPHIYADLGYKGFEAVPTQSLDAMLRRLRIGAYA
jgi:hypothetical protein